MQATFNTARKYGAKISAGVLSLGALSAFAVGPIDDMFAAINLTGVAVSVGAIGLLIVGATMAFKAIDLAKRGVRKV